MTEVFVSYNFFRIICPIWVFVSKNTTTISDSYNSLIPSLGLENTLVAARVGKRSRSVREEEKYFVSFGVFNQ